MINYIRLIEHNQQRQLRFIKDAKRVHHVGDECVWVLATDSVSHIQIDCGKLACKRLRDNLTTSRLGKCFDLARGVHNDVAKMK